MSEANVEVVRKALLTLGSGDLVAGLAVLDPASECDVSGIAGWPEKDVYRGREEIGAFVRTWASSFKEWRFDVEEVRAAGDERVYAAIHEWGVGAASGASVDQHRYSVCSLRAGRIVLVRWFSDRVEALKAVGLRG